MTHRIMDISKIMSMSEIMDLLRKQADLRAEENDEGGILQQAADDINRKWLELDDVTVCPGCGAVEGTAEWGTVGDGFDGYCPSCADQRDHREEDH